MTSEAIRHELWERDGGLCGICGTAVDPLRFHLDHIVPVARGGPTCADNLRVAHPRCNIRRGASERRRVPSTTVYRTTTIALPDDLHAEIRQLSDDEDRPLNRTIVRLLRAGLEHYRGDAPSAHQDRPEGSRDE